VAAWLVVDPDARRLELCVSLQRDESSSVGFKFSLPAQRTYLRGSCGDDLSQHIASQFTISRSSREASFGKESATSFPEAVPKRRFRRNFQGSSLRALEHRAVRGLSFPLSGWGRHRFLPFPMSWVRPKTNGDRPGHFLTPAPPFSVAPEPRVASKRNTSGRNFLLLSNDPEQWPGSRPRGDFHQRFSLKSARRAVYAGYGRMWTRRGRPLISGILRVAPGTGNPCTPSPRRATNLYRGTADTIHPQKEKGRPRLSGAALLSEFKLPATLLERPESIPQK